MEEELKEIRTNGINNIPPEIMNLVADYLDPRSTKKLKVTSKHLNKIVPDKDNYILVYTQFSKLFDF